MGSKEKIVRKLKRGLTVEEKSAAHRIVWLMQKLAAKNKMITDLGKDNDRLETELAKARDSLAKAAAESKETVFLGHLDSYIKQLVATGLYGDSAGEVIKFFVREGIIKAVGVLLRENRCTEMEKKIVRPVKEKTG